MQRLEAGVFFREHRLTRSGHSMRVWIYAPTTNPNKAKGLVLIAPAGSDCLTGNRLGKDSRPEHLPYVRAGYAVAAYDLDGALPNKATHSQRLAAMRAFRDAGAGVKNARAALDYVLKTYPGIDRDHIFASGHSSAGTVALLSAARDLRIKAVVAFAPATDLRAWLSKAELADVEKTLPGYGKWM